MENRNLQWNKRVKVPLILICSVNTNHESVAYRSFSPSTFEARGARKVTTGITGLWRPSVHSDVAFLSFDVGSSYHTEAEFGKRWIVHPLIGNVSWDETVVRQVSFTLLMTVAAMVIQLSTRGTADSDNWFLRLSDKAVPRSYHLLDNG